MNRYEIANIIVDRLSNQKEHLKSSYLETTDKIAFFYIDNLLPEDIALKIYKAFPKPEAMKVKKS